MTNMRYYIHHLFLRIFHGVCAILPLHMASSMGGWIAQTLGGNMAINRKAMRHIRAAMQCDEQTARDISKSHWNNLGRIMAEYPHLKEIATHHVRFKGEENLIRMRDDGKPGITFGAHIGNWEIISHSILHHFDLRIHPVYRAPNNPYVDKRLHNYRTPHGKITPYPKSRAGMIGMVRALKSNEHLGLLVDQKYNEGTKTDFFGMPAMTGTAFIELAQKYDCPLVPIRCVREKEGFLIEICPPLATKERNVMDVLNDAHTLLEQWIKDKPSQWLWLHRRWKNEDLRDDA